MVVHGRRRGHAVEPRAQVLGVLEPRVGAQRAQQRVLHDVLGVRVAGEAAGVDEQLGAVGLDQGPERGQGGGRHVRATWQAAADVRRVAPGPGVRRPSGHVVEELAVAADLVHADALQQPLGGDAAARRVGQHARQPVLRRAPSRAARARPRWRSRGGAPSSATPMPRCTAPVASGGPRKPASPITSPPSRRTIWRMPKSPSGRPPVGRRGGQLGVQQRGVDAGSPAPTACPFGFAPVASTRARLRIEQDQVEPRRLQHVGHPGRT